MWAAYDVAKAGIDALTRYIAVEYGPVGIRANAVAPGADPHAAGAAQVIRESPTSAVAEREMSIQHPLERIGEPEEVAAAAAWLLSDEVLLRHRPVAGGRRRPDVALLSLRSRRRSCSPVTQEATCLTGSQTPPASGHAQGYRQRGRRRHLDGFEGGEWRRHQRAARDAAGDPRRGGAAELPSARAGPQPQDAQDRRARHPAAGSHQSGLRGDDPRRRASAPRRWAMSRWSPKCPTTQTSALGLSASSWPSAASTASSSRSRRQQRPDRGDRRAPGAACLRQPARHHRPQRHRRRRGRRPSSPHER